MLTHEVLFLLSNITKVLSGGTSPDLTRGEAFVFCEGRAGCEDTKCLNLCVTVNLRTHTDKGVVFNSACVKRSISSDIAIITNLD